jgi:hypothetical protein
MPQSALTYRTGVKGADSVYLGKLEFSSRLVSDSSSYMHNREWQVVRVDRIEPPFWTPSFDFIPTVYVSPIVLQARRHS